MLSLRHEVFPFIVGVPRSGTTLLLAMLNCNEELAMGYESEFVVTLAAQRGRYERGNHFAIDAFICDLYQQRKFLKWGVPEDAVRMTLSNSKLNCYEDAVRYVFATFAAQQGKRRYGDKTPFYVQHMPLIASLFPEARFIHIVRDGRDVALSLLETEWGPKTLEDAARQWANWASIGRYEGVRLGSTRYTEVLYEALVGNPERELRRLCAFTELTFDPAMLLYWKTHSMISRWVDHPESHRNLECPPTKGLRDWRLQMKRREIALFEMVAGHALTEFGYHRAIESFPLGVRAQVARSALSRELDRLLTGAKRLARRNP